MSESIWAVYAYGVHSHIEDDCDDSTPLDPS
jgi:hypothetical protein